MSIKAQLTVIDVTGKVVLRRVFGASGEESALAHASRFRRIYEELGVSESQHTSPTNVSTIRVPSHAIARIEIEEFDEDKELDDLNARVEAYYAAHPLDELGNEITEPSDALCTALKEFVSNTRAFFRGEIEP